MTTLTRLERFQRSRKIKRVDLSRESGYTRQHIAEVSAARREPTRKFIAAILSALRRITLESIQPGDVFELTVEESGVWEGSRNELLNHSDVHNADAERLVQHLRTLDPSAWEAVLNQDEARSPAALIRSLIRESKRAAERQPTLAAALARAAVDRSRSNEESSEYGDYLRGCAWLAYANAIRHVGDYAAAHAALDSAEDYLSFHVTSANELAQSWYVRASVYWKQSAFREAFGHCRRAQRLFELLADSQRTVHTRILEAGIHFERGEHVDALRIWEQCVEPLRESKDRRTLASVWMNLGTVEGYLGHTAEAREWLEKALKEFARMGVKRERTRAQWSLGFLLGMHGARARGLRLLRDAYGTYEALRMRSEAAFVGLDLAEVLLLHPGGAVEASELCQKILAAFEHANLRVAGLKAVAFLCEAIRLRRAQPTLVVAVRSYIHELDRNPEARFQPAETAG